MIKALKNVPVGWNVVLIPEVLYFQEGPGVRKWQFTDEGVKLLNVGNINNREIDLSTTKVHISEEEANGKYSHFLIDEGDLLIACSGIVVSNFPNKVAFVKKENLPLCLNTSTMRFKSLNEEVIDLNYFRYYLQTNYFTKQLQKLITGSAQLNFGPSHIKKIELLLPPLETQKKIAAILDKADKLRQLDQQLIEKYDALTQSLFLDMFGDPVTNSKGWDLVDFKDVLVLKRGFDLPVQDRTRGDFPIMASNGILDWHNEFKVKGPGVVTGRSGTLGKVHFIENNYWPLNTALYSQDLKRNNPLYILFLLRNFRVERFSRGAGVPTLNRNLVHSEKIISVPIELQNQFAERVEAIEAQKALAQQSLEKSEELFNSLLQKAFKGELV